MKTPRSVQIREFFLRLIMIAIGSTIFAAGVALFLDPLDIAPGGLSGVAIILSKFLPLETGAIYLLLNVPMLLLGLKKFGREFLFSTVFATALVSLLIDVIAYAVRNWPLITEQALLASMTGSACTALGAGIIFRCGCTTGGVDILVKVLRSKYPHIKSGVFTMAMDAIVVAASAGVFRNVERSLIAAIGIIIYGIVLNQVLYRTDEATMMLIVSNWTSAPPSSPPPAPTLARSRRSSSVSLTSGSMPRCVRSSGRRTRTPLPSSPAPARSTARALRIPLRWRYDL